MASGMSAEFITFAALCQAGDHIVAASQLYGGTVTQLDVTLRSAKERRAALESAANRRDTELSAHEFTILGVYRQRSERISVEANQCIGNEAGFLGDTRVSSSVDPTIPDNEGSGPPAEPFNPVVVPPPSCASCSL